MSATYAQEIQTAEHGHRLDGVLRAKGRVLGIVNGVDYGVWNPATDSHIAARFDAEDASNKARCKDALRKELGFPIEPDVPIVASVAITTCTSLPRRRRGTRSATRSVPFCATKRPSVGTSDVEERIPWWGQKSEKMHRPSQERDVLGTKLGMLSRSPLVLVLSVLVTAFACGGTVDIGSDGDTVQAGPSSSTPDAAHAATDASAPEPGDGVVACPYGLPADHPNDPTASYHRHCSVKADCAIAYHVMDCGGNRRALGVEPSEASRFAVGICGSGLPGGPICDRPEDKPTAETGEKATSFAPDDIDVRCENEICQTYVATFACGPSVCDSRSQYCKKFVPGIGSPDGGAEPPSYNCEPIPTSCADTPDCTCMMNGMPAGNSCEESNGHVTLTLVAF